MNKRKKKTSPKRMVWRMSDDAPLGEWIDPDAAPPAKPEPPAGEPPESASSGWRLSSYDLLRGTEISESPDTVPDALFDELFGPPDKNPKPPGD